MFNIILPFLLSISNLIIAIFIYLTLQKWFVTYDQSGMQLIIHIFITAPISIINTIWFLNLSNKNRISSKIWKVNTLSILIPIISIQTGVTYYHYNLIGLFIAIITLLILLYLFTKEIKQYLHS